MPSSTASSAPRDSRLTQWVTGLPKSPLPPLFPERHARFLHLTCNALLFTVSTKGLYPHLSTIPSSDGWARLDPKITVTVTFLFGFDTRSDSVLVLRSTHYYNKEFSGENFPFFTSMNNDYYLSATHSVKLLATRSCRCYSTTAFCLVSDSSSNSVSSDLNSKSYSTTVFTYRNSTRRVTRRGRY